MADIVDINRFENAKKLASYLGLTLVVESSHKRTKLGSLNKESRKLTRSLLSQAVIHFYNLNDFYKEFTARKKKGKCSGKVRVAVMRKVITNIFRMLKDGKYFNTMDKKNHSRKTN